MPVDAITFAVKMYLGLAGWRNTRSFHYISYFPTNIATIFIKNIRNMAKLYDHVIVQYGHFG